MQRSIGLAHPNYCTVMKQELPIDSGTRPVQIKSRSGSESGRSSSNPLPNSGVIIMGDATFPRRGKSHTLVMSGPKRSVPINIQGRSVQQYLLPINELLPRYVRMSLAGIFFNGWNFPIIN